MKNEKSTFFVAKTRKDTHGAHITEQSLREQCAASESAAAVVARAAAGLSTNAHYARVSKSSRVRCVASRACSMD